MSSETERLAQVVAKARDDLRVARQERVQARSVLEAAGARYNDAEAAFANARRALNEHLDAS